MEDESGLMANDKTPTDALADVVNDPTRIADLSPGHVSVLLTQWTALQASMAARLVAASQAASVEPSEKLLSVEQAAERLGVSKDWLYRRTSRLPFVIRVGRHVRFSAQGIERFIRSRVGR
jgi:excisionase family DNA binding protein